MKIPSWLGKLAGSAIVVGTLAVAGEAPAAVYTSGCSAATTCTLQELIGGGEITAGGQRFSSFDIEVDPGGIDFSQVVVVGLDFTSFDPGPGLRFVMAGEGAIADADCVDLQFSYRVTPVITSWHPFGNELRLDAETTTGTGRVEVDEALFDLSRAAVGDKTVGADPAFDRHRTLDTIGFPPQNGLIVANSVLLESDASGDVASLGAFTQRFALQPAPEPGSVSMLAAGALALGALGRGRRAAKGGSRSRREVSGTETIHEGDDR